LILLGLLWVVVPYLWSQPTVTDTPTTVLEHTQQEFCPDSRLDIYDIEITLKRDTLFLTGETSHPIAHDSLIARLGRYSDGIIVDDITVLPEAAVGDSSHGVICVSTAYQRREPDVRSENINQGIMGDHVRILKKRDYYYLVQLYDGYLGWMLTSFVQPMTAEQLRNWQELPKVIYMKSVGHIYQDSTSQSIPVSDIVAGAVVAHRATGKNWTQVRCPDGNIGTVKNKTVMNLQDFQSQEPSRQDLVRTAKTFMGIPYFWGGRSAKGFDCSGFTNTIYKLHDITLPRDANMQVETGRTVPLDSTLSQIRVGDLLFFGVNPDRITHVAMYIGNHRFIHSDGKVRINSLNPDHPDYSEYRHRTLRQVRRFLEHTAEK
jgi:cell wall-associated NlpC family hydrolase